MMVGVLVDIKCSKGIKGIMKRDGRWNRIVAKDGKEMCSTDDAVEVDN